MHLVTTATVFGAKIHPQHHQAIGNLSHKQRHRRQTIADYSAMLHP
jgi:hypothetical protein